MAVKAIQLLMNEGLPEDMRDYNRTYDSASIKEMMTKAADLHPDEYADIIKHIMDVGRDAAYYTGQTSKLSDYKPIFDRKKYYDQMDAEIDNIKATIKNKDKQQEAIKKVYEKYVVALQDATKNAFKEQGVNNNLINAVRSGARGNLTQLNAMITTPGLYTDFKGRTIPLFIRKSYAEGLTPAELLSSTFGTRSSIITIKKGTAAYGGLGKSINRPMASMTVTSQHSLDNNGIDLDVDDDSLYGRVLARDAGKLKAGSVIDRNAVNYLRKSGLKTVIVKSPIATISAEGIPADVVGLNIQKRLYNIGESPGLNASTAISEPLIQGGLCLEGETLVKMANGSSKKIKNIEIGDEVLAFDKKLNKTVAVKVKNAFDQGLKHCYKFKINDDPNITVKSTLEHKYLFDDDKVKPIG